MAKKKMDKKATKTVNGAEKNAGVGAAVLAKIATMPAPFRAMGERLHTLILRSAPGLQPTLWYGMPAYAKDGKVICFFRADKYMTFGLSDKANHDLEEGAQHQLRESAWFFSAMDDATEAKLSAIVRRAAS
ncbi:MAG: DUF1801 domain-containing protein [Candidatus Acidiferrum sp.]